MIAAIALGAVPQPGLPASMREADPIVVTARFKKVRFHIEVSRAGELTQCHIRTSSGDREIDQIGCNAARLCLKEGERARAPFEACTKRRQDELLTTLIDARATTEMKADNAQD